MVCARCLSGRQSALADARGAQPPGYPSVVFIARRRSLRPSQEYRVPTDGEWAEFTAHFAPYWLPA